MNTFRTAAFAAAFAITITATAQNLSTEVVVDRSIQPIERTATRLGGLWPSVILPQAAPVALSTANYNELSPIMRSYTSLNPAPGASIPLTDTHRGYFAIGYFPTYNLGVSAGYRAIATERNTLDLWLQFDGTSYKAVDDENYTQVDDSQNKMKYNGVRFGVNFSHNNGEHKRFDASLDYQFAQSSTYLRSSQDLNAGMFRANWLNSKGALGYNVGFHIGLDSFGGVYDYALASTYPQKIDGTAQLYWGADGGISIAMRDNMSAGLDLMFDFVDGMGIMDARPYYSIKYDNFNASIGLKVGAEANDGLHLKVAPDVQFAWTPTSQFAIKANVTGGLQQNSARTLRQITPFLIGSNASPADIPVDTELRMLIGPFEGFSAELFGGYAIADNWVVAGNNSYKILPIDVADIKGWHAGIDLKYRYRWLHIGASAEAAPSDGDNAYYLWRDRAKYVIKAFAEANPIDHLTVGLNYEFRGHRNSGLSSEDQTSLGCVSNLGVHASYTFTPTFSVFASAENLLNRRYEILSGIPSQGITGLAGISLKF